MQEAARRTRSRFASTPVLGNPAPRNVVLGFSHEAVTSGRTLFPSTVITKTRAFPALKSGVNSKKIGGLILKGKWAGFPVYTLTLEERATCPAHCVHWRSCYGNKMQYAERLAFGSDLEWRLEREVAALALKHRGGFAVRLHNLGDFYSVAYVEMWASLLTRYPALHCFGFSARWKDDDAIAVALRALVERQWDRFAVRFSNAPFSERSTISIRKASQKPDDTIICPEQAGQTESCSTCGLCWQSTKRVAFLQH